MADKNPERIRKEKELELLRLRGTQPPLTAQEEAFTQDPLTAEQKGPRFPTGAILAGTVGGVAGARLTPLAPSVGATLGAGLAAPLGELAEQKLRGEEIDFPRAGREGQFAAIGEGTGRLAIGIGARVLNSFIGGTTPEAIRAIKFLDQTMPGSERSIFNPFRYLKGKVRPGKVSLLPAEATENRLLDIMNNAAESSIIGGEGIQKFKFERTKLLANIANDLVDTLGTKAEPDVLGELFVKGVQKELKLSRTGAKVIFNTVEDIAGGTRISLGKTKDFARPLLAKAEELKGVGAATAGDDMIKSVMGMADDIDLASAQELRSRLINVADDFSVTNPKAKAIGRAKFMAQTIDTAIENGLKETNPEALRLWRGANKLWREGSEKFDNDFLRGLIRQSVKRGNPELIPRAILKNRAVSNIRRAKAALGGRDTPVWKQMQSFFVQDAFEKSLKKGTNELMGASLEATLQKMGKQSLREIFTPGQLNKLQEFANALKVSQAKQAEGAGRMFIQLTQAGAIMSVPFGKGINRTAATILLAPAVFSKAFTNPKIANILINGVKTGTKSRAAAGAMGRFVTDLVNLQESERQQESP